MVLSHFKDHFVVTIIHLEIEKRVFKQFGSLSNVKREGDALVITFGSDKLIKFDPEARPGPASKEKINWMNNFQY